MGATEDEMPDEPDANITANFGPFEIRGVVLQRSSGQQGVVYAYQRGGELSQGPKVMKSTPISGPEVSRLVSNSDVSLGEGRSEDDLRSTINDVLDAAQENADSDFRPISDL